VAELAKAADADRDLLVRLASDFMQQVQDAQKQLLAAVKGAVSERSFEASVYHHMATATVTLEQINAVDQHLRGLQRLMARCRQREEVLRAAAATPGAGGGGGGGVDGAGGADEDALMFDGEGPDALPQEVA